MIFDTLAAMADWLNDGKFDDGATPRDVQQVLDDLGRATSTRESTDPVTRSGAMQFGGEDEKHKARVFASAMQTRTPRSELESAMA